MKLINRNTQSHACLLKPVKYLMLCSLIATTLSGCMSTDPKMGGGSGNTITGGAGGGNADGENTALEKCDQSLGTLSVFEDTSLPWWRDYRGRYPDLGSTVPVIRLMIQQSNCFVVVERGRAMAAMNRERELMQSGQLRTGSNVGGGQMVAADYTISPEIQFAAQTNTAKAIGGALLGTFGALIGGGLSKNEANTTLLLIDNRSGVQLSASIGSASNYDFSMFGGLFGGGAGGLAGGWSKTPEGKILVTAFADSYNQMVKSLRNYKAQEVAGGLGKGGGLQVGGVEDATPIATTTATVPVTTQTVHIVEAAPVVSKRTVTTSVETRKDYNFEVDQYDEDAFNDYYNFLKGQAPIFTSMGAINDGNENAVNGMTWNQILSMMIGYLDSKRIELEAWPYEARKEAWRVMGNRIEQHTKNLIRSRDVALENTNLNPTTRSLLESIQVVTKETLFPEGF